MNLKDNQKLALKNCQIKSKMHQKNLMHLINDKFIENNINLSYIEFQIHGIVDLTQDVEKITMSKTTYEANKELVDKFISKYYMIDVIIY